MSKKIATGEAKPKSSVNVHVSVPKGHTLHKKLNLSRVKIGKPHHVNLHGKVTSVNEDEFGKSFGMDVQNMGFGGAAMKPSTMIEEMAEMKKRRTKGKSGSEDIDG